MDAEQYDVADRLQGSAFLSVESGMAYSALAYLLVAGLFAIYFGWSQERVEWLIVIAGLIATVGAVAGNALMLRRFLRFLRAARAWAALAATEPGRKRTGLEHDLTHISTRGSSGPADWFMLGGLLFPPFGEVFPYLAVIATAASLDEPHGVDLCILIAALVVSTFCAGVAVTIVVGLMRVGRPLRG